MKIDVPFDTSRLIVLQEISVKTVHETLRMSISFTVDSKWLWISTGSVYIGNVRALVFDISFKERTVFADRAGRKHVSLYFAYRLSESVLVDVMIEKPCTFQRWRKACVDNSFVVFVIIGSLLDYHTRKIVLKNLTIYHIPENF